MTEKIYRKLIEQVLKKITEVQEWHDKEILEKIGNVSWAQSIHRLHERKENDLNSQYYRRLAYDEILSNLLILSQVRKRIKKYKLGEPRGFEPLTPPACTASKNNGLPS